MSTSAQARADRLKKMIAEFRRAAGLELGFALWDGSLIPADYPSDGLMLELADEGVIAALMRRPNIETLANLWSARRIEIRNGTIFDLASVKRTVRTREMRKSISWSSAIGAFLPFALVSRGGPWPLEDIDKARKLQARSGNKADIQYHYDVSNKFYALWLGREMVYTCGYCTDWSNDLDTIQVDKLEMICRKLRLKPGEKLLDLGCGWGALSCYAAQNYGVTVHGVSLSQQQVAFANEKIERLGLQDRVHIELKDYADVDGQYDKVASIGLHEHIGLDNHDTYYATIQRVLKDGGLFLNHAITRPAKRNKRTFRRQRPEYALLTKYIFPGAEVDHIGDTVANLERSGFEVHDVEGWRRHYAITCKYWHDNLLANYDAAVDEVGDIKARMWLTYLAACSITFERGSMNLFQTLASKRRRGPSDMPPTRAELYRDKAGN